MKTLRKQQVMMLHEQLVDATGGSKGLRDDGMLESALAAPFQSFGDADATHASNKRQHGCALGW